MRVKKTTANGTTLYAWDNDRIFAEYDQNGNAIQETVYFGSTPVALLKDGQTYRIYADQIDTPRVITDGTNTTLWAWDSKPFGESQPNEDVDQDGTKLSYNLRFPGQYYDAETGKHYNFNRDYDPVTGRYVQSDPIGLDGGMNGFTYVNNTPIIAQDMNGLWASKWGFYAHQDANARALPFMGGYEIQQLNAATNFIDSSQFQDGAHSYMHAMRGLWNNKPNNKQTVGQARTLANSFVRRKFSLAWQADNNYNWAAALRNFGEALHTLQDSTSPSHRGFQFWSGYEHWYQKGWHGSRELHASGGGSLDQITYQAWIWFVNGQLPNGDLFVY